MGRGKSKADSAKPLDTKSTLFHNKTLSRKNTQEEEKKEQVARNKARLLKAKELREYATKIRQLKEKAAAIQDLGDVPKLFPLLEGLALKDAQDALGSDYIVTNKSVLTRDYNPYRIKVETEGRSNQFVIIEVKGNG